MQRSRTRRARKASVTRPSLARKRRNAPRPTAHLDIHHVPTHHRAALSDIRFIHPDIQVPKVKRRAPRPGRSRLGRRAGDAVRGG